MKIAAVPRNYHHYLVTLRMAAIHGSSFEPDQGLVLGLECNTELPLVDLLSEHICSRIGCEKDGYLAVDPISVPPGRAARNASQTFANFPGSATRRCEGYRVADT